MFTIARSLADLQILTRHLCKCTLQEMGLFFVIAVVSIVIGILYLAYLGYQCLQKLCCPSSGTLNNEPKLVQSATQKTMK